MRGEDCKKNFATNFGQHDDLEKNYDDSIWISTQLRQYYLSAIEQHLKQKGIDNKNKSIQKGIILMQKLQRKENGKSKNIHDRACLLCGKSHASTEG